MELNVITAVLTSVLTVTLLLISNLVVRYLYIKKAEKRSLELTKALSSLYDDLEQQNDIEQNTRKH